MNGERHYLRALFLTVVCASLFLATMNLLVDPYGLFHLVSYPGFNTVKPHPDHSLAEIKMETVLSRKANALIIGNSRAEIGFDPEHPAWKLRSLDAYNLAVPGSGIEDSAKQILQLYDTLRPEVLLLGLDFPDFLIDPSVPQDESSTPVRLDIADRVRLRLSSLFSIQASVDSLRTLRLQRNLNPESMTGRGFNPLLDYGPIARRDGYYSMFRQRALSNAQRFAHMPKELFMRGSKTSSEWASLTRILNASLNRGSKVTIIIYPYHAQLLAMFEKYGLWSAFEAWKKEVVELAQAEQKVTSESIDVWDFSGFSNYQCEAIPAKGDRNRTVRWYWEAGHFKKELGDVILARVFDRTVGAAPPSGEVFGVRLTGSSLQQNIARIRDERKDCAARNPEIFDEVAELTSRYPSATNLKFLRPTDAQAFWGLRLHYFRTLGF